MGTHADHLWQGIDFDQLSKSNVLALAEGDIFAVKAYDEEKSLDLTEIVGFDAWSKAFHHSLCHKLNEEEVPLSYVTELCSLDHPQWDRNRIIIK